MGSVVQALDDIPRLPHIFQGRIRSHQEQTIEGFVVTAAILIKSSRCGDFELFQKEECNVLIKDIHEKGEIST
jgi:hypothetical protein